MIALDVSAGARERRRPSRGPWLTELRATLVLAAPLILTNLAQHGLVTADVVLLGRLGAEPLAAGALATSLYFILFICGIGLASAVSPLIAGAIGRGDSAEHGRAPYRRRRALGRHHRDRPGDAGALAHRVAVARHGAATEARGGCRALHARPAMVDVAGTRLHGVCAPVCPPWNDRAGPSPSASRRCR